MIRSKNSWESAQTAGEWKQSPQRRNARAYLPPARRVHASLPSSLVLLLLAAFLPCRGLFSGPGGDAYKAGDVISISYDLSGIRAVLLFKLNGVPMELKIDDIKGDVYPAVSGQTKDSRRSSKRAGDDRGWNSDCRVLVQLGFSFALRLWLPV